MRDIRYIAVHCTASNQMTTIRGLEMEFKRKGWKNPGYHYVVSADGVVHQMLDEERVSNGVKGWNSKLINVAYIGGIDATGKATDNRDFSPDLNGDGKITRNEWIKACPCFDAKVEYKDI